MSPGASSMACCTCWARCFPAASATTSSARCARSRPKARRSRAIREEFGLDDDHLAQEKDLAAFYMATLDVLRHARIERARVRGKDLMAALMIVLLVSATAVPGAVP